MVDYVAVLRRTIDALPKNTPEIRARVYDKARQTVQAKLAMINPPPSQALIAKQLSGLEVAIGSVESDFNVAIDTDVSPVPIVQEADPLIDVLRGLPDVQPVSIKADGRVKPNDLISGDNAADVGNYELPASVRAPIERPDLPELPRMPDAANLRLNNLPRQSDSFDDVFSQIEPASMPFSVPSLDDPVVPPVFSRPPRPKARPSRIMIPLIGLVVLAGAGALAWIEKDRIIALLKPVQPPVVAQQPEPAPEAEAVVVPAETGPAAPDEKGIQKFTQRLNADGTENDAGTGTGSGEQSVAQLEPAPGTETPAAETPAAATPAAETPATETPAAAAETPAGAAPVGQKAIFYEERTSGAEGSARTGAVVWSVVRESPGNDRPPEAAVRGELSIPEAGLNVRMTLRRNADTTLPASHILELIMTVPDDFEGGTIEDVQRVNLKPTEESAGAPLVATPVKVAEKYFLVALENNEAAAKANLDLLRNQSWIDLPVVYRTGRRALFTMEKGLVGDQIFKQVLDAWDAAPLQ